MGTPYQVLYDSVTSKLREYDLGELSEVQVNELLHDYIRPAVVRFQSASPDRFIRDDEAKAFENELTDNEIEILSDFMVVIYLDSNYIRTSTLMKQGLPSKDFRAFSPSNHLEKLISARNLYLREAKQLMRDYSYEDSSLYEVAKG